MREPPSTPPEGPPPEGAGPDSNTWARVNELFHEAIGLDPEARELFLAKLARTDAALAGEVRSLLAAHERSADFLAESPTFQPARVVFPGDRLGPYRIIDEIGHGGMGIVYRARREDDSFTKVVAIKLIDPGLRSDQFLRRFRDERQILAMLDHPNIARLLDGGAAPDGSPYLVMEYVDGQSLLDYCDARHLGIDARLELFLKVCDAVQFAHQRLIVHRDLKSDNVLVTPDGSPHLLDFGVAKLIAADGDQASVTLTAPMNRPLTPDYASPEQVRGEPAAVGGDVYSLGVILYELLTGARPLRFTTRNPEEILRVALFEEAKSPSAAMAQPGAEDAAEDRGTTVRHLRRRLSGDLDFITLRALEKDAARRYGSVDQFARDLRRHADGHPVLARGQSTTYRMSRFVRRNRAAVATTALVTLALVAGLAGTTWQASVARLERDRAKRRFEDVRALAHAVMFDLHDAIANLPGSTKARETLVLHALRYLDRLRGESQGDVSLQRELGSAYAKIADVQGRPMFPNLGHSAPALESYDKAIALLETVSREWPDSAAVSRDLLVIAMRKADLLGTMGRDNEAMALMLEVKQKVRAEIARHPKDIWLPRDLGVVHDRLFDMKILAGDTTGALAEYGEDPTVNVDPRDPVSRRGMLITHAKLGEVFKGRGQRDSALASYVAAERLAIEAVQALPNDTDASRDLSIVYGMRGLFMAEEGPLDSALAVYGRGMKISEDLAAADPENALQQTDVASGHFEIGGMLMGGGRYRAAEERFREAFERFTRLAAADTGNVEHRLWLARSCRQAGEACGALSRSASTLAEHSRWRAQAETWFDRGLARYDALARGGLLPGDEASAPQEIRDRLAALRRGG